MMMKPTQKEMADYVYEMSLVIRDCQEGKCTSDTIMYDVVNALTKLGIDVDDFVKGQKTVDQTDEVETIQPKKDDNYVGVW